MKTNPSYIVRLGKRGLQEKIYDYTFNREWKNKGDLPAVVDFSADWCAPCKMVSPILYDLSDDYAGKIKIYKVTTEKDPEVAKIFGVSSIPTRLFITKTGKPMVDRGAQSRQSLKSNIERILPKQERRFLSKILSVKW
jgi:thioredoxin 1